jgi:hypothetical protein
MMVIAAVLILHADTLCHSDTGGRQPLVAVFAAGAFPVSPIRWSSTPLFALYDDGVIVYRTDTRSEDPAFESVRLSPMELSSFLDSLSLDPDFFRLNESYDNFPQVSDLGTYTIWAWRGDSGKSVALTGLLDFTSPFPRADPDSFASRTPSYFIWLYKRLLAYRHPGAKSWYPTHFEILLDDFSFALTTLSWPVGWPRLDEPGSYRDNRGILHLPFTAAQVSQYLAVYAANTHTRAFELGGMKWFGVVRPVFPGERCWNDY